MRFVFGPELKLVHLPVLALEPHEKASNVSRVCRHNRLI